MKTRHHFTGYTKHRIIAENLVFFIIVGTIVLLLNPPCFAKTLHFGVFAQPGQSWIAGVKEFKGNIEKASGKKIVVKIISEKEHRNPLDLLYGVQSGKFHIALTGAVYLGDIVKAIKIFGLPFLFRDKAQTLPFIHGSVAKALLKETDKYGLVGLDFVSSEDNVIINTVRPIGSPDDLKGLKLASIGFPMQLEVAKALGAVPVLMSWKDATPALARGAVSVAEGPPSLFYKKGFFKHVKYMTFLPSFYNPGVIVANPKIWKHLSTDERKLIEKYITAMTISIEKKMEVQTFSAIKSMIELGVTIEHPLDIMPFRQAVKPIFEAASMALPKDFRLIAYNTAYVERELKVCSKPDKAAVHYRRYGNKRYQKFQSLTDTNLTLEYAAWYIRVEKDKYYPDEKLFDPYVSSEWRVDFDLKPVKK